MIAYNKSVKPFACGSLGRSALRTCSGMASPLLPEQALHAERRLPGRQMPKMAKSNEFIKSSRIWESEPIGAFRCFLGMADI